MPHLGQPYITNPGIYISVSFMAVTATAYGKPDKLTVAPRSIPVGRTWISASKFYGSERTARTTRCRSPDWHIELSAAPCIDLQSADRSVVVVAVRHCLFA